MKATKIVAILLVLLLIATSLMVSVGCGPPVTGSGDIETREFDFSDFDRLEVGYAFDVEVTQSSSYSISVTADDNIFEYIIVSRRGDSLIITMRSNRLYLHTTQQAVITMPDLERLELSGASRGDVSGFVSSDKLGMYLSGASSLIISTMKSGDATLTASGASKLSGSIDMADGTFEISGASNMELDGDADDVRMDISGASRFLGEEFTVDDANLDLSGASSATINAQGTIDADLSGASSLYYIGSPTLGDIDVSGASKIRKR